jgi:hypothetical protein
MDLKQTMSMERLLKKAVQHDFEVCMYTDKDYGQLVEDHIFLINLLLMGMPLKSVCSRNFGKVENRTN